MVLRTRCKNWKRHLIEHQIARVRFKKHLPEAIHLTPWKWTHFELSTTTPLSVANVTLRH